MKWTKQPITGQVAQQLDFAGKVDLADIRTLATMGTQHAVVALHSDPKHWHHWFHDVAIDHWSNLGQFSSLTAAKITAEAYESGLVAVARQEVIDATAGLEGASSVVVARWAVAPYFNEEREDKFMSVPCRTPYTAGVIGEIFKRLGCAVEVQELENSST